MSSIFLNAIRSLHARTGLLLKPDTPTYRSISLDGLFLIVPINEAVGWNLCWRKSFEPSVVHFIRDKVRGGDVCIDVGCNIGYLSLLMKRQVGSTGRVLSFEPDPITASLAQVNFQLNDLQVELRATALAETKGQIDFYRASDSAYSGLADTGRKKLLRKLKVEADILDNILGSLDRQIKLLKIDVEGAELQVLKGFQSGLKSNYAPKYILVENSAQNQEASGNTFADVDEVLRSHRYTEASTEKFDKNAAGGECLYEQC